MIFVLLLEVKPRTSCELNKSSAIILRLLFSPFLVEKKKVHFNLFCVERKGELVVVGVWRSEDSFQEFVLSFRHMHPKGQTLLLLTGLATGALSW